MQQSTMVERNVKRSKKSEKGSIEIWEVKKKVEDNECLPSKKLNVTARVKYDVEAFVAKGGAESSLRLLVEESLLKFLGYYVPSTVSVAVRCLVEDYDMQKTTDLLTPHLGNNEAMKFAEILHKNKEDFFKKSNEHIRNLKFKDTVYYYSSSSSDSSESSCESATDDNCSDTDDSGKELDLAIMKAGRNMRRTTRKIIKELDEKLKKGGFIDN